MRRVVLIFVVFLLLQIVSVSAGESYDVDLTGTSTQAVYLYEDDEVRFELLGATHALILNDVGSSSVKIALAPFIGENNDTRAYETILGLDYILKLDLDKDGTGDINVALYSIADDGQVHLVLQDAVAEEILEEAITGDIGLVDTSSAISTKTISFLVIGVLVLGLILFLFFRNGKKDLFEENREHKSHEHTEEHSPKVEESS